MLEEIAGPPLSKNACFQVIFTWTKRTNIAGNIFKCFYLTEFLILIQMAFNFDDPNLTWIISGNGFASEAAMLLPEPMMTQFTDAYLCH